MLVRERVQGRCKTSKRRAKLESALPAVEKRDSNGQETVVFLSWAAAIQNESLIHKQQRC